MLIWPARFRHGIGMSCAAEWTWSRGLSIIDKIYFTVEKPGRIGNRTRPSWGKPVCVRQVDTQLSQ